MFTFFPNNQAVKTIDISMVKKIVQFNAMKKLNL